MKNLLSFFILWSYLPVAFAQPNTSSVLEECLQGIVTVAVYKTEDYQQIFGYTRGTGTEEAYKRALNLTKALGTGSGFVIEHKGKYYVITNAHVIDAAADEPQSIFVFGVDRSKHEVRVVGGDTFYDIAVLEFSKATPALIKALPFASKEPRIGEKVYAIGNSLGKYPYTVTDGIISGKNRIREDLIGKYGYLQSTATITWGNSGGPLLNEHGEVLGVNSFIEIVDSGLFQQVVQSQINFALESPLAQKICTQIIEQGKISRAYLGIEFAESYDGFTGEKLDSLPLITGVIPDGPAYFDLYDKINWAVTRVNGVEISNLDELLQELEKLAPTAPVKFNLLSPKKETAEVSFIAEALGQNALQDIASFFLSQQTAMNLLDHTSQILVSLTNHLFNLGFESWLDIDGDRKSKKKKNNTEEPSILPVEEPEHFFLIAVEIGNRAWRIKRLEDFGAALKFCGLQGAFTCHLMSEDPSWLSESITEDINLMNEAAEVLHKIWY